MISFIIPTLNEEKALEKTLQHLKLAGGPKKGFDQSNAVRGASEACDQAVDFTTARGANGTSNEEMRRLDESFEIIISDGGSTDKTIEIAKKYTDKIWVHNKPVRQTIAMGRNDGAKLAKGDILVFIDADVIICDIENFVKRVEKLFEDDKKLMAVTGWIEVMKEVQTIPDKIVFKCLCSYHMFMNNVVKVGVASGEFMIARTKDFEQVGGFNEKLVAGEDYDFFGRMSKHGKTFFDTTLKVIHPGRRAHKIGWPRLLTLWFMNWLTSLFGKSFSKEWKVIR